MRLNVHKDAHLICHNKFEERSRKFCPLVKINQNAWRKSVLINYQFSQKLKILGNGEFNHLAIILTPLPPHMWTETSP